MRALVLALLLLFPLTQAAPVSAAGYCPSQPGGKCPTQKKKISKSRDDFTAKQREEMMEEARKTPFTGIGKPEPLKQIGADVWSRRITGTDRLVYRVLDDRIDCLTGRYHSGK